MCVPMCILDCLPYVRGLYIHLHIKAYTFTMQFCTGIIVLVHTFHSSMIICTTKEHYLHPWEKCAKILQIMR